MEIDKDKLKEKLKKNPHLSSRQAARHFGCSQTTIRRKAAEIGIKFNGKSNWCKYEA
jgi:transcriptional antiterminator